jgi:3alpha(or 20beta)-hydroxysteroid dehydrogenase
MSPVDSGPVDSGRAELDGRVALVSGGARGLGAAIARQLAGLGARVVIGDLLADEGGALAVELGAAFVPLDVTSEESWAHIVSGTFERLGRLDVLVNNAGIGGPTPILDTPLRRYERIVAVNQTGTFLGMRAAVPVMVEAGRGSVVNIASIEGLRGLPGFAAYCGAKHAVVGMSKAVALEVAGHGVRVNAVCPGPVETPGLLKGLGGEEAKAAVAARVPLGGRLADPAQVAELVGFLAGDGSSYCTGSVFTADGGWTAG